MSRAVNPGLPAMLLPATLVAITLPFCASAEGNRLVLDCALPAPEADAPSEAGGAREAAALPAHPVFSFAPVRTGPDGAGEVHATGPDGQTFPGVTASHTGPYAWTAGTVLNTLTVEGTATDGRVVVLWHRLDQAQAAVPPAGQLTKLICEVS